MTMHQIGGPGGPIIDMKNDDGSDMTTEQINEAIQAGHLDKAINNPDAFKRTVPSSTAVPPDTGTAIRASGETAKNLPPPAAAPVQPATGLGRELGIAGGQYLRGLISPFSIPGDIGAMANQATGGLAGTVAPSLQGFQLPTSQSLDRLTDYYNITGPAYTPQGFWENELAAGARGAGEATTYTAGGPLLRGAVRPWAPTAFPSLTRMGTTIGSGAAGGAAGEAEAQMYEPDPLHPGLAGVGPIATSAFVSGLGPSIERGLSYLRYGDPYENVINRLGVSTQGKTPTVEDAGDAVRTGLENNYRSAVASGQPAGAGGVPGTDLDQDQFDSLTTGTPAQTTSRALQGSRIGPIIARELPPDTTNMLTGAAIANNQWASTHPKVRESLIPNMRERVAVDAQHGGDAAPGANLEQRILDVVRSERGGAFMGALGGYVSGALAHQNQTIQSLLSLAGYAAPYYMPAVRRVLGQPGTMAHALLGGSVGVDPAMYMTAPGGFAAQP